MPIAQEWKDAHPGEELPDYFVTAMDLVGGGSYPRASGDPALGGQLDLQDGELPG